VVKENRKALRSGASPGGGVAAVADWRSGGTGSGWRSGNSCNESNNIGCEQI